MEYCIDYKADSLIKDKVNEININFKPKDEQLLNFIRGRNDLGQRVNISISNEEFKEFGIDLFDAFVEKDPGLNFKIKLEYNKEIYDLIKQRPNLRRKYYYNTYINNWDELYGYIDLKPSDIYVVENLGFELDRVSKILHYYGIRVRVFPNVAQSSWRYTSPLKKFFIRPEEIDYCDSNNYVDVCEFYHMEKSIETYYKIYAKDKKWFGKLNELIIGFDSEFDSKFLNPTIMEKRFTCGKKCLKGKPCNICRIAEENASVLEDYELFYSIK